MTTSRTAKEKRNVARIRAWAKAWSLPGGSAIKMVDECYAKNVEVLAVLQGKSVVRTGQDKSRWRDVEKDIEKQYAERAMDFHRIVAQGNSVAIEATVCLVAKDGTKRQWPFAAFFTFDGKSRIRSDHTYMPNSPHTHRLVQEDN